MSAVFKNAMIASAIILMSVIWFLMKYPSMTEIVVYLFGGVGASLFVFCAVDESFHDRKVSQYCDQVDYELSLVGL